ncbi:DUF5606 family protein [Taibaiella soli]|uniref:Uncharacterized protein n=1 Tax=Taibaiella soli TaxID=1649169 RepID=A0A2W2ACR1_9BACT|nr:DUF5606 domain-containing protein [Taibaiella soli]PZF73215.1 hypothetical protein DN068_10115 [Taibaiella soli]
MEYREIVAVTGLGGLFQLLATKSDGAIVRNLADKSTKFISARLHNVTPLESIEVYTTGENVRLHEVFQKMQDNENSVAILNPKSDNNSVKNYFKTVFPDFDEERVYISDMKKMLKWYELLKENSLLNFDYLNHQDAPPAELIVENEAEVAVEEEKPAKKAKAKKAEEPASEVDGEEKPAKKAARKKKAEEVTADGGEEKPKKTAAKKKKTEE